MASSTSSSSSTSSPALLVCVGKDCRRAKGHDELLALARQLGDSVTVPCQDICDGPVVGVAVRDGRGRSEVCWYAEVRKQRHRDAVRVAVRRGEAPDELAGREDKSRRGKVDGRRKAETIRAAR